MVAGITKLDDKNKIVRNVSHLKIQDMYLATGKAVINNIALIYLTEPLPFNNKVHLIPLHNTPFVDENATAVYTTWKLNV